MKIVPAPPFADAETRTIARTINASAHSLTGGWSLRIGTEELGRGDGFFVGADVPYAYVPGAEGVEVLEFRGSNSFDIRLLANNPAFWTKTVESVTAKREEWTKEQPPSGMSARST
ncbi:hypothetical protein [Sphingomonas cavernae]|uniref:hypothetical protein n=1 Tax=Sphingomonas cavernae TaxID=2320861 RepID=UPI001EE60768|nr:hypothetical protein [Sphingomonas cavernae]